MNDITKITDKIIANANNRAKSIMQSAEYESAQILETANFTAQSWEKREAVKIERERQAIIKNRMTLADIDNKKAVQSVRRQLLDDCFEEAIQKIHADSGYKAMVVSLIEKHAEDGDEVVICQEDKKIITAEVIAQIAKKKGIKLSLSKGFGDFFGGVIISCSSIDKNLTLASLFKNAKERIEPKVADILFEDPN